MSPLLEGEFALWSAEMNEPSETASPTPPPPEMASSLQLLGLGMRSKDSAFLGVGWELCENGKGGWGLGMGLLNPTGSSWESSHQRTEVTGTGQEARVRGGGTVATHPCPPQLPPVLRDHGTK